MNTIRFIIQKEFLQIFRNRLMLAFILLAPIIQLLILAYAATFEIRNIHLFIVDQDKSPESRALIDRFVASENFLVTGYSDLVSDGDHALLGNDAVMVLQIPPHAGRELLSNGSAPVSLRLDAVDGFSANIASQYAMQIITRHNEELRSVPAGPVHINVSRWYNPELNYQIYMVPGILVLLITVIGGFLSGMNVVREKELGTIEQLNVTPITKTQFIIGKLTPFWILALVMFSFGLLLARFWFEVPFEGSLLLIYVISATYLLVVLGLGLLVSTVSQTQQQAIFITWFIFVIFILLSGLFTPIYSMPEWAQYLTRANPVAWLIDIFRRVMLTGAGMQDIWISYLVLLTYGIALIASAIGRYRKSAV